MKSIFRKHLSYKTQYIVAGIVVFISLIIVLCYDIQSPSGIHPLGVPGVTYELVVSRYDAHSGETIMEKLIREEDEAHEMDSESGRYQQRINRLTQSMVCEVPHMHLNFGVYLDPMDPNAFAAPDGSVRVFASLMDIMNDEQLTAVIAHELGHINCGHVRKLGKRIKMQIFIKMLRLNGITSTDGLLMSAIEANYSRSDESEADAYSYHWLADHGISPCAMSSSLERLCRGYGLSMEAEDAGLWDSHPTLGQRIQDLQQMAEKDGYHCHDDIDDILDWLLNY